MKRKKIKKVRLINNLNSIIQINTHYRWIYFPLFTFLFLLLIISIVIILLGRNLPSLTTLEQYEPQLITRIYSSDSKVLDELFVQKRIQVPLERMPDNLIQAVIATEDRRFFQHWGLDLRRIIKAAFIDILTMSKKEGASTLTQQLARNLYLSSAKLWTRKIRETLTALQIERTYSKPEILEMYLNHMYFAHSSYGIEAAARKYFHKNVDSLKVEESALLIGILQRPKDYSPYWHPDAAKKRRNIVMNCMLQCGHLIQTEYDSLCQLDLNVIDQEEEKNTIAPYFCEYVRQLMEKKYGLGIYTDGLSIYTSLDTRIQACADTAVKAFIPNREKEIWEKIIQKKQFTKWLDPPPETDDEIEIVLTDSTLIDSLLNTHAIVQTALIAMNNSNGHILAMIGGRDFKQSKFNRAVQAKRQPGSAFKPIVYTVAIDNGYPPCFELLNQPVVLFMPDGSRWSPRNINLSTGGPTTLREALLKSINLVSIRLVQEVIPPAKVTSYAKKFGFSTPIQPYDAIALGVSNVIPLELVSAFSVYANKGVLIEPTAILRVEDKDGNILEEIVPQREDIISEASSYIMTNMLQSVIKQGSGSSVRWRYGFNRPAGGKTGTTNEFTDAWFIGFTPQITAGVWVGIDGDISLGDGQQGSAIALPIWAPFMKMAHDSLKLPVLDFEVPQGVEQVKICNENKKIARESCPYTINEIFLSNYIPRDTCNIHLPAYEKQNKVNRRKRTVF
jgi:penicillin-binding protein 1A